MKIVRSLAIAAATVSLGVGFMLWERRRRRGRQSTDDTVTAAECSTADRSSDALSQPADEPTCCAAVATNSQHHIRKALATCLGLSVGAVLFVLLLLSFARSY